MNYKATIDYLYHALPMYQRQGPVAMKPGLDRTITLCSELGNPHQNFDSIHIAGTNGKGSSCHMLASICQAAEYKTGLYTSPHLNTFRERIRINGAMISEEELVDFVSEHRKVIQRIKPSFFEITVAMAFNHFAKHTVDIAVIEVGLGGRLDSTNIINPLVSLITNIGFDHMNFLGSSLSEIAREKAGIIKPGIPVVISEYQDQTIEVFSQIARANHADILIADQEFTIEHASSERYNVYQNEKCAYEGLNLDLKGAFQLKNLKGVLGTIDKLREKGIHFADSQIVDGIGQVRHTGISGRFETLAYQPMIICDTGHNPDGMKTILSELAGISFNRLWMIIGLSQDKDLEKFLSFFPEEAYYLFCQSNIPRAMPSDALFRTALEHGLTGEDASEVNKALDAALRRASKDDLIFIGGSTFIIAELNRDILMTSKDK